MLLTAILLAGLPTPWFDFALPRGAPRVRSPSRTLSVEVRPFVESLSLSALPGLGRGSSAAAVDIGAAPGQAWVLSVYQVEVGEPSGLQIRVADVSDGWGPGWVVASGRSALVDVAPLAIAHGEGPRSDVVVRLELDDTNVLNPGRHASTFVYRLEAP